jgi:hypothetical protein
MSLMPALDLRARLAQSLAVSMCGYVAFVTAHGQHSAAEFLRAGLAGVTEMRILSMAAK